MSELFRRDGHLLDLAIDRLLTGELRPDQVAELEAHAASCAPCAEQLAEARGVVDLPAMSWPTPPPAQVIPLRRPSAHQPDTRAQAEPANRVPRWWVAVGGMLAAAAALLVIGRPDDSFQTRGGAEGFGLQVFRQGITSSERLYEAAEVHPEDKLGFRVLSEGAGHLLVLGLDATGAVYPCHPSTGTSEEIAASTTARPLSSAITLDATPGEERLVALRCPEPVSLFDVGPALAAVKPGAPLPTLKAGCAQDTLTLRKVAPTP